MAHIRFHCMSKEFLQSVVLGNELIQQENSWKEQVEGALDFHNRPKRQLSPQLRAMATPRRAPNVLYLIGEASTRVEMFDLEKGSCFPVDGMAQTTGAALVVEEELYTVMGGGLRIEKYDAKINAWTQVSAGVKESETAVCEGMGYIYVIGGNRRVKCFHVSTRTWISLPHTKIRRSFHAVTTLLGKVYVIGGATLPGNVAIADVECYNPAANCWVSVAPMRTERYRHQAAVLGGRLYVIGGTDQNLRPLKTVEVYEPTTNSWTFVSSLNVPRRDFGVGVLHGMIFVFGGSGSTNAIERYDNDTKKWTVIGALSKRWSDVKCVSYPMIQIKCR